jgi:peroxiredoxin
MKIVIGILLATWMARPVTAQSELQACSQEKNTEIVRIINEGKGKDTTVLKRIVELDKEWKNCVAGKSMPDFSARSIKGKRITAAGLKGKIIVANFWFTTCPPCIAEMPALNRLVEEYDSAGVVFLGFAINDKKRLRKFLKKTAFKFTIIPDSAPVEEKFGVIEHPITFVIDQEGKVRKAWAGGSVGEKAKDEAYVKIKPVLDELVKAE